MDTLSSFIPIDRRQAGAAGAPLPDRATGAALLADLSDFTPLTEALTTAYGPQRGAEEITAILQRVYDPLIAAIDSYRGSVVTFSGDALTAWFDADDGRRATTCALALQAAVAALPPVPLPGGAAPHRLGLKVAVAAGRVRRFLVGDPAIQVLDTLAGATLDWLAAAERLAQPGEVVLDPATAAALGAGRPPAAPAPPVDLPTGPPGAAPVRYVVVPGLAAPAAPAPWPEPPAAALPPAAVRPWLLPAVWDRLQSGQGEFLSDLRPVVTLFLHFTGIDYDLPDAGAQLDAYIRGVQEILARYAGSLLGVILGDKGNYLYAAFGAPLAHAGDAGRAAAAALELGATLPAPSGAVQIGLAGGQVWAGAYGGQGRRAYGVLGDAVNLGARLMQAAAPGQILVSGPTRQAAGDAFAWQSLPPLQVKGKAAPVPVLALTGAAPRPIQLLEPAYRLPLVGRDAELALVAGRLARAQGGHGQIVGLTAEAGMGKSRLVAAVAGLAARAGLTGYGGAGQAYGTNTPYLAWGSIWRAFFGLDPAAPVATQMRALARALARCDPALLPRLPLLGVVLDLPLPENDLTRSLDPGLRKASLESLLIDCLRSRVRQGPLLLVLEDSHWLDPLSHDLLEAIGRAIATLPVLLVLAYRPLDLPRLQAPRISTLPYFTEVPLADLTPAEAARLIALQLGETLGAAAPVPPALVARVTDRAGGNPFFIEELLNYIRDQGRDLHDPAALAALDLPGSLHSLLLSRIDRLTESQQVTLKVASVIGRLFAAAWLWGVYPQLGSRPRVKADLDALHRLDLTPLDSPEPNLTYLFKHIVTQEVAYGSLTYAMRARLHEQLAGFLEATLGAGESPPIDLLAYHYGRSQNTAKQREYYRKAGAAALAAYANSAAIDYYEQLLPLLLPAEQGPTLLVLGQVLERVGQWDSAEARYRAALALRRATADPATTAAAQQRLGVLLRKRGQYGVARDWLEQARAAFAALDHAVGLCQTLGEIGQLYQLQSDYAPAQAFLKESLDRGWAAGAIPAVATALHHLGLIAWDQADYAAAQWLYEESLALSRQEGDKPGIATALTNLGRVAWARGDYPAARALHEESLALRREIGDRAGIAQCLNNLGNVASDQDTPDAARALYEESLALRREIGDKPGITASLNNLGVLALNQRDYGLARALFEEALVLKRAVGDRWGTALALNNLGVVTYRQHEPAAAVQLWRESLGLCREQDNKRQIVYGLVGLAAAAATNGEAERAVQIAAAAARLLQSLGAVLEPEYQRLHESTIAALRAQLPAAAFAAAWETGHAWSSDEAVDVALAS